MMKSRFTKLLSVQIILLVVFSIPGSQRVEAQLRDHGLIARITDNGLVIATAEVPPSPLITLDDIDLFGGDPDRWWLVSPEAMQLSPDRQLLALPVVKSDTYHLFIVDMATGSRREVVLPYPAIVNWSPDSESISVNLFRRLYTDHVYASTDAVSVMIYEYSTDTLSTLSMTDIFDTMWSSDSSTLFFSARNPGTEGGQDIYRVSRDGSGLQRITNVKNATEISVTSACGPLAYNSSNQRIYFSTVCGQEPDVFGFVLSVPESGNDLRVESSLDEIAPEEDTVTGVEFATIEDIWVIDDQVNVAFDANVYINSAVRKSWRIIQLNDIEPNSVIFNYLLDPALSSLDSLDLVSVSPMGTYITLSGRGQLIVADIVNRMILVDTSFTEERICYSQWQDNINLLYSVSDICSTHAIDFIKEIPGSVYSFNVQTQTTEIISMGDAWIVPVG